MELPVDGNQIRVNHHRSARAAQHAPRAHQPAPYVIYVILRTALRDGLLCTDEQADSSDAMTQRCQNTSRTTRRRLAGGSTACPPTPARWLRVQDAWHRQRAQSRPC